MISVGSDILQAWVAGLLLPLTRILGFIMIAPVFSHRGMPQLVKISMGLILALIIVPTIPAMPQVDLMSASGLLLIMQEMIIGIAMGFVVRIIFTAIDLAGQLCGMTMGLGFATFFDPQSQGNTAVISQFFGILALMVFLSLDGHLALISAVAESFHSMPIVVDPQHGVNSFKLVMWGGKIFSAGLQLALPVVAALLITNMALGVLTRSAPQLNLFGIGFPITIGIGFVVIALMLPSMAVPFQQFIEQSILATRQIVNL